MSNRFSWFITTLLILSQISLNANADCSKHKRQCIGAGCKVSKQKYDDCLAKERKKAEERREAISPDGQVLHSNRFASKFISATEHHLFGFQDKTGLVKEIQLQIELWTLLNQPVEKYLTRWVRGDSVTTSDGTIVTGSMLAKYPDLVKRFNSLEPSKFDLQYSISGPLNTQLLSHGNVSHCGIKVAKGKRYLESHDYYITKAGQVGDDLSPQSPKNWKSFIQWNDCKDQTNLESRNTFALLTEAKFSDLKVTNLVVPTIEIDSIAREFKKREKTKDNKKKDNQNDDKFWEGEDEKIVKQDDDEFWQGADKKDIKGSGDKFWSGADEELARSDGAADDFWSGKTTKQEAIEIEKEIVKSTGDQFIGEETVSTSSVIITYFDHGEIDGDRVNIYLNKERVASNVVLTRHNKNLKIRLREGVNRISFEALNNGSVGNNTASFTVTDDNGNVLYSNEWEISKGYKGTLLLIKI